MGGPDLLSTWALLTFGRFGGVKITFGRVWPAFYVGLSYFLAGSDLLLGGSDLLSTWVLLTFGRFGGDKITFGRVWSAFYLGLA